MSSLHPLPAPRSPWRTVLVVLVIAAAIAAVFHPIVFGGYTIAQSNYATHEVPAYGAPVVPVTDPGAGGRQDEPWLVLIRRALAHGEVALVNLSNGLGSPLLESLQSGALYVANPLLLLLDTSTPAFFDVFVLLHVLLFVCGLYALSRLYARASVALPVAILVGLSGITLVHVNMVHYRSQAWTPWAAYAIVQIARGERRRAWFCLLAFAHVAMFTSGALQEAFVGSLLLAALFAIELASTVVDAPRQRHERLRRSLRAGLALASSSAIACVSFVPYLVARADGDLFTAAADTRAIVGYTLRGLAHFLVPHVSGLYPYPFTQREFEISISDFSTLGVFLQDTILEVFGAEVLHMSVRETTSFQQIWGGGVLGAMLLAGALASFVPVNKKLVAAIGGVGTTAGLLLLTGAALSASRALIWPALIVMGVFTGLYTLGALSTMMELTVEGATATYMGLWGLAQALGNGLSAVAAGALHSALIDSGLLAAGAGYAAIFAIEAGLMFAGVILLGGVDVAEFRGLSRSDITHALELEAA